MQTQARHVRSLDFTTTRPDRLLTVALIQRAMEGNDFWLHENSLSAHVVNAATRAGYVSRYSHTQVCWTHNGLTKARAELGE